MLGSRVTVLGFFAASLNLGMIYIWIAFLFHCLLMSIFFRPQKEKRKEVTYGPINLFSPFHSFSPKSLFLSHLKAILRLEFNMLYISSW